MSEPALPAWLEPWGHDLVETKIALAQPPEVLAARVAENIVRATSASGTELSFALSAARVTDETCRRYRRRRGGVPTDLRGTLALSMACGVDLLELFEVPFRTRPVAGPDWARIAMLPPTREAVRASLSEGLGELMGARGLAAAELARECGLGAPAVSKALGGHGASVRTALLLAAALGASPACLCGCAGEAPRRRA